MHHHLVGDVDPLDLLQHAISSHTDIVEERRGGGEVGESQQLSRLRTHFRMRRHRAGERAAIVLNTDSVEVLVDLPGPRSLVEAEDLLAMQDHVRVRGAAPEFTRRCRRTLNGVGDVGGLNEPVAMPFRLAVAQANAVHHAIAKKPVVRASRLRVGTCADVGAVELRRDRALDMETCVRSLLQERRPVAAKMPGKLCCGVGHETAAPPAERMMLARSVGACRVWDKAGGSLTSLRTQGRRLCKRCGRRSAARVDRVSRS